MKNIKNITNPSIIFVIGSLNLGGAESQMVMLATELTKLGYRCKVFVLELTGPLIKDLTNAQIQIYSAHLNQTQNKIYKIFLLIKAIFKLRKIIKQDKINIIQGYLPLTNLLSSIAGKLSNIKIVTSRRALGTHQERHYYWKPIDRITNYLSDIVTANSEAVAKDTQQRDNISKNKLQVIYNGIDLKRFIIPTLRIEQRKSLQLTNNLIAIVTLGNLIPYKGHKDLLEALSLVITRYPNLKLFIIGEDRGIEKDLKAFAKTLGLTQHISFLGQQQDIPKLLKAMDIFVMPSHEEGFSNAILEAMASQLPIIATDVGGNKEALNNGKAGIIIPPRKPTIMAEKLISLLNQPQLCQELALLAYSHVKNQFSTETMIWQYINLYSSLYKNKGES